MNGKNLDVTIAFRNDDNPNYAKALDIAKNIPTYREITTGKTTKHIVSFDKSSIKDLFELYNLSSDFIIYILINGKTRPFARELWLPMLWFYL